MAKTIAELDAEIAALQAKKKAIADEEAKTAAERRAAADAIRQAGAASLAKLTTILDETYAQIASVVDETGASFYYQPGGGYGTGVSYSTDGGWSSSNNC